MTEPALTARPLCSEEARERGEFLGATASRVEHWLLVEYGGYWPYEPLDATVFAGGLRDYLAAQLSALPRSRLLLIKQPGRSRRDRVRVFFGTTLERGSHFFTLEVDTHADLAQLDFAKALAGGAEPLGEPLEHPLLLVCTHGKRDRCCARYGRPLCSALHARAGEWVWQASHVGGDRFAGNLVCLPEGLYFGHVDRAEAGALLDAYLGGRIALDRYRGRSCYAFATQAAELHVRRLAGLTGFHDLRLLRRRRVGDHEWTVELLAEVAGDVYEVDVRAEPWSEPVYLTCRSELPKRPRRFVAHGHRVRAGG